LKPTKSRFTRRIRDLDHTAPVPFCESLSARPVLTRL